MRVLEEIASKAPGSSRNISNASLLKMHEQGSYQNMTHQHIQAARDAKLAFDASWDPLLGYPNLKIERTFYFGGMKKQLKVPLSTPNRVIIEPNPPRQGYSHLTWNTLNSYYLQKALTQ